MAIDHASLGALSASGSTAWVRLGTQARGIDMQRFQLFASGSLGGGTLVIEACLHAVSEDPNADAPSAGEIFKFGSTALTDLTVQEPPNFITKAQWVRATLTGATTPAVKVWIR